MKEIKKIKNPFLIFLPFLLLYVIFILLFSSGSNQGDEGRYLNYAHNLTNGFYSLPLPYLDLGDGPGYPIILMPFVLLKIPVLYIKLMNAVFQYLSVMLLFKSLKQIFPVKFSLIFSLIWALYPNTFEQISYALPEVFTASLIPLLLFTILKVFEKDDSRKIRKYILIAGFTLGYIALTKPIFGYVLMFMIPAAFLFWVINRTNINYKKCITILIIAFITTLPWLAYTYHMSGKVLYWSSFGGNNLYWMSSPYKGEYGDWIEYPPYSDYKYRIPQSEEVIKLRHQKDFDEILKNEEVQMGNLKNGVMAPNLIKGIAQDDLFKRIAIENIESHPLKFLQNCLSNVARMLFNYPNSYTLQKPSSLYRLPINGTLVILVIFCLIPTLINWQKILFPIRFLLLLIILYLGGSTLGSATPRMFTVAVPILLFWIAYIINKTIKVKLKFN
ncbi:MAG: glycosyltransferase family 39 protein [Bacteroidota bacterium]|nr:glycosyltransferase family 39 protein [Bacteroidota bacterium]